MTEPMTPAVPDVQQQIPFNIPYVNSAAANYLGQAIKSKHQSGNGPFGAQASALIRRMSESGPVFLTTSGTAALELACMALDLQRGDEVIVPSYTFSSTATAPLRSGATVRFCDIDEQTLCAGLPEFEPYVTSRTRAVITVNYAGISSELDVLADYCAAQGVALIEDNAHGFGGSYRGQPLGSFGDLAALSFHETKNASCGEGGALLENRPELLPLTEIAWEKGTNRLEFFRGEVQRYRWLGPGSSFVLSDILAAMLLGQLEGFAHSQASRLRAWEYYSTSLSSWAVKSGCALPFVPHYNTNVAHMFYLLAPDEPTREALLAHLRDRGIGAVSHYVPLHSSPAGRRFSASNFTECHVTDSIAGRLLRLPLHARLTTDQLHQIVDAIMRF